MSLRLYSFCNFYLSSIQQGIQTGHAAVDLVTKYSNPADPASDTMLDWAKNHKTFICKNGGAHINLKEIEAQFDTVDNYLPWCSFYEEPGAVAEASTLTCVSIVVTERIWDTGVKLIGANTRFDKASGKYIMGDLYAPEAPIEEFTVFEYNLIELIKRSPNAR